MITDLFEKEDVQAYVSFVIVSLTITGVFLFFFFGILAIWKWSGFSLC